MSPGFFTNTPKLAEQPFKSVSKARFSRR